MRGEGTIRIALAFAALLASLSLVVWRQSRALEVLRDLDGVRSERAAVESERAQLQGRIQRLEGRARVKQVAESRLGMRIPSTSEQVTLRRPVESSVPGVPGTGRMEVAGVLAGGAARGERE